MVGYWWSHYETGSPQSDFAHCNICGENMAYWSKSQQKGLSLPKSVRQKINGHHALHNFQFLVEVE